MRIVGTVILAGLLLVTGMHALTSPKVLADGALAVGTTGNLREGSAFGFTYNYRTHERASEDALEECKAVEVASEKVKANCRVVATFRRECVSVALTSEAPGFGWAIAPDQATADQRAVAACQGTAGKGRTHLCRVDQAACDEEDTHE